MSEPNSFRSLSQVDRKSSKQLGRQVVTLPEPDAVREIRRAVLDLPPECSRPAYFAHALNEYKRRLAERAKRKAARMAEKTA